MGVVQQKLNNKTRGSIDPRKREQIVSSYQSDQCDHFDQSNQNDQGDHIDET